MMHFPQCLGSSGNCKTSKSRMSVPRSCIRQGSNPYRLPLAAGPTRKHFGQGGTPPSASRWDLTACLTNSWIFPVQPVRNEASHHAGSYQSYDSYRLMEE